jgi:hypothetical protein
MKNNEKRRIKNYESLLINELRKQILHSSFFILHIKIVILQP